MSFCHNKSGFFLNHFQHIRQILIMKSEKQNFGWNFKMYIFFYGKYSMLHFYLLERYFKGHGPYFAPLKCRNWREINLFNTLNSYTTKLKIHSLPISQYFLWCQKWSILLLSIFISPTKSHHFKVFLPPPKKKTVERLGGHKFYFYRWGTNERCECSNNMNLLHKNVR